MGSSNQHVRRVDRAPPGPPASAGRRRASPPSGQVWSQPVQHGLGLMLIQLGTRRSGEGAQHRGGFLHWVLRQTTWTLGFREMVPPSLRDDRTKKVDLPVPLIGDGIRWELRRRRRLMRFLRTRIGVPPEKLLLLYHEGCSVLRPNPYKQWRQSTITGEMRFYAGFGLLSPVVLLFCLHRGGACWAVDMCCSTSSPSRRSCFSGIGCWWPCSTRRPGTGAVCGVRRLGRRLSAAWDFLLRRGGVSR